MRKRIDRGLTLVAAVTEEQAAVPWERVERFQEREDAPARHQLASPALAQTSDQEAAIDAERLRLTVERVLASLSEKERTVLLYRFGFKDHDEETLDKVAARFGRSRERIRQIEAQALRSLRNRQGPHFVLLHAFYQADTWEPKDRDPDSITATVYMPLQGLPQQLFEAWERHALLYWRTRRRPALIVARVEAP